MMRVLVSDKLAEEGIKILEAEKGIKVDCQFGISLLRAGSRDPPPW